MGLKNGPRVSVAEFALLLKQQGHLIGEQHTRKRLPIVALLVALGIGEFGEHHFGRTAVAFLLHAPLGVGQTFLDSATFAGLHPGDAIPAAWDDRARKAWMP